MNESGLRLARCAPLRLAALSATASRRWHGLGPHQVRRRRLPPRPLPWLARRRPAWLAAIPPPPRALPLPPLPPSPAAAAAAARARGGVRRLARAEHPRRAQSVRDHVLSVLPAEAFAGSLRGNGRTRASRRARRHRHAAAVCARVGDSDADAGAIAHGARGVDPLSRVRDPGVQGRLRPLQLGRSGVQRPAAVDTDHDEPGARQPARQHAAGAPLPEPLHPDGRRARALGGRGGRQQQSA